MAKPVTVGLMVPINNTTMADEMLGWLPAGSRCVTVKIPRGTGMLSPETLPAYRDKAIELAAQFASPDIDIVAYGCTAAGFISGPAGDASLADALRRVTGKPVVTTARAMVQALQAARAKEIALVTPYSDAVNAQLQVFLTEGGIRARRVRSLYATSTDALGAIQAHEVDALARETMGRDCDALFIGCSQLPTFAIIPGLEATFERPVWTSIRATAREVERLLEARAA